MFPTSSNPSSAAANAPLPPVGKLSTAPGDTSPGAADSGGSSPLALLGRIAPIQSAVTGIQSACRQIVQSGAVPGAEQICAQIVALATSLVTMAAQNLLQPAGGGGGMGMQMPPPPGGPAPIGAQ